MAIDGDTFMKVIELIAVSGVSLAGGTLVGHNRAKRDDVEESEFQAASAKDLVQRAEDRIKEFHGLRNDMNKEFTRIAVEHAKLEGRVEQSERTSGRLETMIRDGFREVNGRLDAAMRGSPSRRRHTDETNEEEG